jgi:hypothetical protein
MGQGLQVPIERCSGCGFDAETWSDEGAIDAIAALPPRWAQALAGLTDEQLGRRPIADMWSVAEYADHVRDAAAESGAPVVNDGGRQRSLVFSWASEAKKKSIETPNASRSNICLV